MNVLPPIETVRGQPQRSFELDEDLYWPSSPDRDQPVLRFTPDAWAKLEFLRDLGPTEVGGFGITALDDLLLVHDVKLMRQSCTATRVTFDDAAVADFFDEQIDAGLRPEQFARVWLHTHPAGCARPSQRDERTFARAFGNCDWSVMGIVARPSPHRRWLRGTRRSRRRSIIYRQTAVYARLRLNVGPGGSLRIPVVVDFSQEFKASEHAAWRDEYENCVQMSHEDFECEELLASPVGLPFGSPLDQELALDDIATQSF